MEKKILNSVKAIACKLSKSGIDSFSSTELRNSLKKSVELLKIKYPTEIGSLFKFKSLTFICTICFNEIEKKEMNITKCNHRFHNTCLNKWIREFDAKTTNPTCPCCRASLAIPINREDELAKAFDYIRRAEELHLFQRYRRSVSVYTLAVKIICKLLDQSEDKSMIRIYISCVEAWTNKIKIIKKEDRRG